MRSFFVLILMALTFVSVAAQEDNDFGIWISANAKKKINRKWGVCAEAELRTVNGFGDINRWSVGLQGDYNIARFLKADVGYTLLENYNMSALTSTGKSIVDDYWLLRHRVYASLTGKFGFGNFSVSLRERYQLTHNGEMSVAKYKIKSGTFNQYKTIEAKTRHILRSRIELSYDINGFVKPFVSYELHHFTNGFRLVKSRLAIGSEIRLTKKQTFEVAYKYNNPRDEDETNSHILSLGYKFRF